MEMCLTQQELLVEVCYKISPSRLSPYIIMGSYE